MTYDAREKSEQEGAPIELYEFRRNAKTWRYTSAEQNFTLDEEEYESANLQRSEISLSSERERDKLTITCPRNFPIAELFRVAPKTDVISLTVKRFHRGDGELAVIWKGEVLNAWWKRGGKAELRCDPVTVSLDRNGLQRLCQRNCSWVLYSDKLPTGEGCGVNKADFKIDTTVTAIDGVVITLAELLSAPYAGGFVEKEDADGNFERRFIESADGTDLTLTQPFEDLSPSDTVTVYPGCDHTMETCNDVYDNILNYGGMPFIPAQNPFGSDPIY